MWKPALRTAGVALPQRADGFHALRHFYASVLLDGGESIKAMDAVLAPVNDEDPTSHLRVRRPSLHRLTA